MSNLSGHLCPSFRIIENVFPGATPEWLRLCLHDSATGSTGSGDKKRQNHVTTQEQHQADEVNRAFSAQAPKFDEYERSNPILEWMRGQVHRHLEEYIRPGDSILDINAGTGIDAIHFARKGHPVVAVDIAGGMIAELRRKAEASGVSHLIDARQASYTSLQSLHPMKVRHVLSNFGGLNCIADLQPVADQLKPLLYPNGTVTLVIMPRICPWEILYAVKGKFPVAFRRLRRNGILAHVEGSHFLTYYHPPAAVIGSFGTEFRVLRLRGLASLSPPPYMDAFPLRFPRAYRFLTGLDEKLAPYPPFNRWADHYILTLQYLPGHP